MTKRHARGNPALNSAVFAAYGNMCWLKMPGCSRLATTRDHVIPMVRGGLDVLENLRPACRGCNSKRQDRIISGYGATIHVVIGPPAGGKSTFVRERVKPGDVVIDLDRIALAFMPEGSASHEYPPYIRRAAVKARKAAMHDALRLMAKCTVWLIHAIPTEEQLAEYRALRYTITTMDPGRAEVERRASTQRPAEMHRHIARWYDTQAKPAEPVGQYVEVQRPQLAVAAAESSSRPW